MWPLPLQLLLLLLRVVNYIFQMLLPCPTEKPCTYVAYNPGGGMWQAAWGRAATWPGFRFDLEHLLQLLHVRSCSQLLLLLLLLPLGFVLQPRKIPWGCVRSFGLFSFISASVSLCLLRFLFSTVVLVASAVAAAIMLL